MYQEQVFPCIAEHYNLTLIVRVEIMPWPRTDTTHCVYS